MVRCKELWDYTGLLIDFRVEFEGEGRFGGPLGPIFKTTHIARYSVRNRFDRAWNRRRLEAARAAAPRSGWSREPLVSVTIPTYNRSASLTKLAIPSVLNQTYQKFELIIVGDSCTDDTEERVNDIGSDKIKFYNLPARIGLPVKVYDNWCVAGVAPLNKALELSSGEWITILDDDDEFTPDHIELLLGHALEKDLEMVYGKVLRRFGPDEWDELGSFPLEISKISHMSVLYHSSLKFMLYDTKAWKYFEPSDWNLWRRMNEAGVRIGFTDRIVGKHYPTGPVRQES